MAMYSLRRSPRALERSRASSSCSTPTCAGKRSRRQIALVSQDVYLFHGVARDNPKDHRLFALAEVRDMTPSPQGRGDTATLESELLQDLEAQHDLHDALIVSRNRRWADTIATWLDDERDYLVVVGALHLVGDHGVPSLLERAGYEIRQLKEQP